MYSIKASNHLIINAIAGKYDPTLAYEINAL